MDALFRKHFREKLGAETELRGESKTRKGLGLSPLAELAPRKRPADSLLSAVHGGLAYRQDLTRLFLERGAGGRRAGPRRKTGRSYQAKNVDGGFAFALYKSLSSVSWQARDLNPLTIRAWPYRRLVELRRGIRYSRAIATMQAAEQSITQWA